MPSKRSAAAAKDPDIERILSVALRSAVDESAGSTDPCLAAKVLALRSEEVRHEIRSRLHGGGRLRRIVCIGGGRVWIDVDSAPDQHLGEELGFMVSAEPGTETRILEMKYGLEELLAEVAGIRRSQPITKTVEIGFEGHLDSAQVFVEDHYVEIGLAQKGKAKVDLIPDDVSIDLDLVTGNYVTPTMSVTINGVTKKRQLTPKERIIHETVVYLFSDFKL